MRVSTEQVYRQGIDSIISKQNRLAELQEQVASGKRLLRPSDDPAAMARSLEIRQTVDQTTQYQRNIGEARSRLEMQETVLNSVNELFQRARELAIQVNNATSGESQRQAVAVEIEQLSTELRNLANSRDGNGDYIFAGFQGRTQPFEAVNVGGRSYVNYVGDQGQRFSQIGLDRQVSTSNSGAEVFLMVAGVNALSTEPNPTNTGTASVKPAVVLDPAAVTGDRYRVEFFNPPTQYLVVNETTGAVLPSSNYVPGEPIRFNGIELAISGAPGPVDQFFVEPAARQDVFTTLDKMVAVLNLGVPGGPNTPAINAGLADTLQDLDAAIEKVDEVRAMTGARLNTLDAQEQDNSAVLLQSERTLSRLQDLDMVEAISQLQRESVNMQAAQTTFVQISNLSLFDFLR